MTQPPHEPQWTPPTWEQGQYPLGHPQPDAPAPSHRGRTIAIVASVVVVLLAVGGVFLLTRDSDDAPTGAASPKAGAEQLIKAVAAQDVDGVMDLIDPAEARSFRVLLATLRDKLSPSGVIAASGVPLPYLTASVSAPTTTTDMVTSNVAFVTVTGGQTKGKIDYRKLPTGLRGDNGGEESVDSDLGETLADVRAGFVKIDDGWFFSPTTTALEASRVADNLPSPSFSSPLPDGGGDSPEDAVRGLAKASAAQNTRTAAGYISSAELPALRYYFPVFARNLNPGQGPASEITAMDLRTTNLSGGLKKVMVRAVTVRTPDGPVTYRNGCYEDSGRQQCVTDAANGNALTALGANKPFLVVEENGGRWQVAPLATLVESLRTGLQGSKINEVIGAGQLYFLAPVTGKVQVGATSSVTLNDGGFARLTLTGRPGQCVSDASGDYSLTVLGDVEYYESGCEGFTLPRSGTVDVVVIGRDQSSGTVQVTVREG